VYKREATAGSTAARDNGAGNKNPRPVRTLSMPATPSSARRVEHRARFRIERIRQAEHLDAPRIRQGSLRVVQVC
jgi:hypothetical protein